MGYDSFMYYNIIYVEELFITLPSKHRLHDQSWEQLLYIVIYKFLLSCFKGRFCGFKCDNRLF